MKPILENWTVVLLGDWNTRIFTPQWVSEKLLRSPEIEFEVSISGPAQGLKYRCPTSVVVVKDDRLVIGARGTSDKSLVEIENLSCHALTLLPETPMRAVGVNFGFLESEPDAGDLQIVTLRDAGQLGDFVGELRSTEITRSFEHNDGVLNFKVSHEPPTFKYSFNFHKSTNSVAEIKLFLVGKLEGYLRNAKELMQGAYGKALEDNADANAVLPQLE